MFYPIYCIEHSLAHLIPQRTYAPITPEWKLNEDGTLQDEQAEKALKAYEERTGKAIDRNDPNLHLILLELLADIELQQKILQDSITRNEAAYEKHKAKYEEALIIKDDLTSEDELRQTRGLESLNNLGHDQEITIAIGALNEVDDSTKKQEIMMAVELTNEDMEMNDFAFDFPPIQDAFNQSAEGKDINITTKQLVKPSLNSVTPPKL